MRALVTGATGFVGSRLVARLLEEGKEVRVLSRRPQEARRQLPPGVSVFPWVPSEGPPPAEALEGVEAIFHLAGEPVSGRWDEAKKRRIRESRVVGTRHLVQAIGRLASPPAVLVSASATGYYGEGGERELTEESPPGQDFLARVCQEWEAEARQAETYGVRTVQVRLGVVLHPEGGALRAMLPPFRKGLGGPIGDGRAWWSWIHREDAVSLFLFAVERAEVRGPLNAVAPYPVRQREFAATLGRVLKRPAFLPIPVGVLRLLYGEFATFLAASQRVLPKKALEHGFAFRFPTLEEALRALLP